MVGLEESAVRLSNYLHVLRELVHLSCGRLALEPRLHVKLALGDHVYDDARAVKKLRRRLYELGDVAGSPGAPGVELSALLDRARTASDPGAYLDVAYGELKSGLVEALRLHHARVDPVLDAPSLRLLTQLLHRQERHIAELPARGPRHGDLGALGIRAGEQRTLETIPLPGGLPARDPFVEIGAPGPDAQIHSRMNAELATAELAARTSHEHPEMPLELHLDLARLAWDELRHAAALDRLDARWGTHPVDLSEFGEAHGLDLAGRLRHLARRTTQDDDPLVAADHATQAATLEGWLREL